MASWPLGDAKDARLNLLGIARVTKVHFAHPFCSLSPSRLCSPDRPRRATTGCGISHKATRARCKGNYAGTPHNTAVSPKSILQECRASVQARLPRNCVPRQRRPRACCKSVAEVFQEHQTRVSQKNIEQECQASVALVPCKW